MNGMLALVDLSEAVLAFSLCYAVVVLAAALAVGWEHVIKGLWKWSPK